MARLFLSLACCLLLVGFTPLLKGEDWITFSSKPGPGKEKHIVLVSGDDEYRSEEALPQLAKILNTHHGFRCTVLFSLDKDGTINPENKTSLPGAETLASADLIILSVRYRAWPDEAMKHFVDAYLKGTPIIALRTSTHAFMYPREAETKYRKYNSFGKDVIGEGWVSHWGRHKVEATRGVVEEGNKAETVLKGVKNVFGDTDVYEAYPPEDAKILMRGQVLKGMKQDDPPAKYMKKRSSDKGEQDVNGPMMPIVWTRQVKNEAGKSNRIFCTTMGSATDLANEDLRRLIVNAVYDGVGIPVPDAAEVGLVGEYKPTMYGFKTHQKNKKPGDYK